MRVLMTGAVVGGSGDPLRLRLGSIAEPPPAAAGWLNTGMAGDAYPAALASSVGRGDTPICVCEARTREREEEEALIACCCWADEVDQQVAKRERLATGTDQTAQGVRRSEKQLTDDDDEPAESPLRPGRWLLKFRRF